MTRERIAGGGTGSERRPNWKLYIQNVFIVNKKKRRPNLKDPECSIEEKKLFFKNLSGIEYGGAEEAKKDES